MCFSCSFFLLPRALGFLWVSTLMAHTMSQLESSTPSQLLAKMENGKSSKVMILITDQTSDLFDLLLSTNLVYLLVLLWPVNLESYIVYFSGLPIDDLSRQKMDATGAELVDEKALAYSCLS